VGDAPITSPGTTPSPAPAPSPEPPISASTDSNHAIVKVFYATDRLREKTQLVSYGGARNPSGELHLGRFDVSVPRDHRMGSVERPKVWTFWREDPTRHFIIVNRIQQTYDTFYNEVSTMVRASAKREAFVFVHGYNVTFEAAIYRTAQFAYDLGFDGPPILYSWPSEGTELGYPVDQNNNEWTVDHLRWFLEDVSTRSGAQMIHLIAHSMGNRPLAYALRQIAQNQRGTAQGERGRGQRSPFNQIVLTAPDVDLGTFTQLAQAIVGNIGQRITLYASSNDLALQLSKKYQKYQRAGDTVPDVLVLSGIDTIDVSAVDTSFLGHSYYGDNKSVLRDIFELIRSGTAPDQRFGLRRENLGSRRWWVFRP
jgi:esterase/lipase superfamily enzyme